MRPLKGSLFWRTAPVLLEAIKLVAPEPFKASRVRRPLAWDAPLQDRPPHMASTSDAATPPRRGRGSRPATQYVLPSFPPAAQPEVMRAAEKDEQYLKHVSDTCYDIARRYLGASMRVRLVCESCSNPCVLVIRRIALPILTCSRRRLRISAIAWSLKSDVKKLGLPYLHTKRTPDVT